MDLVLCSAQRVTRSIEIETLWFIAWVLGHDLRREVTVTYDPISELAAIDSHVVAVLGCCTVTAFARSTYLFESLRLTVRDAAYSVALPAVGWFAVHDLGFVLQYNTWFHT
jgi:hypothetical protein